MASLSTTAELFEPDQVSPSVPAVESLQFLEDHGFFYQKNATIGQLVDELYEKGRARSDDAKLDHFNPILRQDSRLSTILDHYVVETPRFRFPWGTTPGVYYNWDVKSSPTVNHGLIAYMMGSNSQWACRDGSHGLDADGELGANGTFQIPEALLENFPPREIRMKEGGVLFVRTRLAHQATKGRSIMLGLLKMQAGKPSNVR